MVCLGRQTTLDRQIWEWLFLNQCVRVYESGMSSNHFDKNCLIEPKTTPLPGRELTHFHLHFIFMYQIGNSIKPSTLTLADVMWKIAQLVISCTVLSCMVYAYRWIGYSPFTSHHRNHEHPCVMHTTYDDAFIYLFIALE